VSNNDPYLIPGTNVLKNKLGLTDKTQLAIAENKYTGIAWYLATLSPVQGNFDYDHYMKVHEFIFRDLYDWAGEPRKIDIEKPEVMLKGLSIIYTDHGNIKEEVSAVLNEKNSLDWPKLSEEEQSMELADMMARLWKVHAFREGNTRTTATFCIQFAESKGMKINRALYSAHIVHFRESLVVATAVFGPFDKSRPEYLQRFVKDSVILPAREPGIKEKIGQAKKQMEEAGSPEITIGQAKAWGRPTLEKGE
jgi:cell filamentation protein